jgi:hypothetical protein
MFPTFAFKICELNGSILWHRHSPLSRAANLCKHTTQALTHAMKLLTLLALLLSAIFGAAAAKTAALREDGNDSSSLDNKPMSNEPARPTRAGLTEADQALLKKMATGQNFFSYRRTSLTLPKMGAQVRCMHFAIDTCACEW